MLSFDITDRNIRIIKGVESNGKIRINSAATLNLEEEIIVNGHVKDVPRLATRCSRPTEWLTRRPSSASPPT